MEHLIRHDSFFDTMLEGKIEGERGRGRLKRSYKDQVKEKSGVASYHKDKDMAHERHKWKLIHRWSVLPVTLFLGLKF